ncbi:hypothetical protein P43SY_001739 [Pythium insidiosum]|uniref:ATPase F1/V1/A1 complex alpha/beta subunit nucleotide-binding domain-containing protein n=1 Tax=Pythium insidiosum TaxID=114742 RepID=A0AAD5LF84_PYTIN|nr:hypothetical protein P43SY_001739 [Pythium insidiosum]
MRRALRVAHRTPRALRRALPSASTLLLPALAPLSSSARELHTSPWLAVAKRQNSEANEAMLMQQMLDAMGMEDDDSGVAEDVAVASELPVSGVVLDVKNELASVSGLRHATIGSVVHVYSSEDEDAADAATPLCRGIVLFLEKKAAHVALLADRDEADAVRRVRSGMHVQLVDQELRIPISVARLKGRAVDPLGKPVPLVYQQPPPDDAEPTASDLVSIAWGSKTVPGLLARGPLREPFSTGVLAVDCLKPLAFGHRVAVLGPRNSGKTRLALDAIAHQVAQARATQQEPPHFVYVCVGKSPARVQQLLQSLEACGALAHTTIVSADERDSLILQYLAPFAGCAVAEYMMRHGPTPRSVVVYDDLAAHTTVVEALVHTLRLPKASQLSLSAHAVLLERSAQLRGDASLTTFALADAPDASSGVGSELKDRLLALADDAVELESKLARQRVYPPIDVLLPGASIRGPPFQSAALWAAMNRLRHRINEASQRKESIDAAAQLGLELEPEDGEVLEFQELVRQFFAQPVDGNATNLSATETELGVYLLSTLRMAQLPPSTTAQELVQTTVDALRAANPELLRLLETHSRAVPWSRDTELAIDAVVESDALPTLRDRHRQRRAGDASSRLSPTQAMLLRRLRR